MSDLHTISGIALLISGFAQLRCGISAYDWQMLAYIAWFSCVTNFACITFLRHYLYQHPRERAWRLLCMGLLVTLLVAAYIPTANQRWVRAYIEYDEIEREIGRELPGSDLYYYARAYGSSTQAICMFRNPTAEFLYEKLLVAFSILFLTGAYFTRIVSVHRYLARDIIGRMRASCSSYVQLQLIKVWQKVQGDKLYCTLARRLLYHPLLVSLCCIQVFMDLVMSRFVDVRTSCSIFWEARG